jgi:hypothetical protein
VDGKRGCSLENDSGGGGAGGTILLIAGTLYFDNSTQISVKGGLGGDSQPKDLNLYPECVGTQNSGACDDCGGGGGGGLIYMLARGGNYKDPRFAYVNILVDGVFGGNCEGCSIEARGLDGAFKYGSDDEICDGIDNTYDGMIDEDQAPLPGCNLPSCTNGVPAYFCPTDPTGPSTATVPATTAQTTQTSARQTSQTSQGTSGTQTSVTSQNGGETSEDRTGASSANTDAKTGESQSQGGSNGGTNNSNNSGSNGQGGSNVDTSGQTSTPEIISSACALLPFFAVFLLTLLI